MDGSYDGDDSTQMMAKPQRSWMQFFRDNWLITLVVVLAVAGLIYWYWTKGASGMSMGSSASSDMSPAEKFTIHRLRGGMY